MPSPSQVFYGIARSGGPDGGPLPAVAERPTYVLLDADNLERDSVRLPKTAREVGFVSALEKILRQEPPAPWPVLVLVGADRRRPAPDEPPLATTRRIMLRFEDGALRPAAAILLNGAYWGRLDPSLPWADFGLATLVARHELYHVRQLWLRTPETVAHADAVEERMRETGLTVDRRQLESMIHQALAASEEVDAVDGSLASAVVLPVHRRGVLRYREENRLRASQMVNELAAQFLQTKTDGERREIHRWLTDLMKRKLCVGTFEVSNDFEARF